MRTAVRPPGQRSGPENGLGSPAPLPRAVLHTSRAPRPAQLYLPSPGRDRAPGAVPPLPAQCPAQVPPRGLCRGSRRTGPHPTPALSRQARAPCHSGRGVRGPLGQPRASPVPGEPCTASSNFPPRRSILCGGTQGVRRGTQPPAASPMAPKSHTLPKKLRPGEGIPPRRKAQGPAQGPGVHQAPEAGSAPAWDAQTLAHAHPCHTCVHSSSRAAPWGGTLEVEGPGPRCCLGTGSSLGAAA